MKCAVIALTPITSRRHQLRAYMAALGPPTATDGMSPSLVHGAAGGYSAPLQLLAKGLSFDPISGMECRLPRNFLLQERSTATHLSSVKLAC